MAKSIIDNRPRKEERRRSETFGSVSVRLTNHYKANQQQRMKLFKNRTRISQAEQVLRRGAHR